MAPRARLDAELVRRGLARSREQAQELVAGGRVTVDGSTAAKAATGVAPGQAVVVREAAAGAGHPAYVSRGGHKLVHALEQFGATGLQVAGRRALDAGASTGGFTDVLLRAGAAHVVAADVGYGQLAWTLRQDPRVTVLDRTNVRSLRELPGGRVGVVTADLSFIPLALVLPALVAVGDTGVDLVLLVKPQFEVGRVALPRGGVVREPGARAGAIRGVAAAGHPLGLGTAGVVASPLPGPAGNVEYLLWLRAGAPELREEDLDRAVAEGPV